MLDLSERTIERMMDRGQLTFRKTPGGQRRLHRTSVEHFYRSDLDIPDTAE